MLVVAAAGAPRRAAVLGRDHACNRIGILQIERAAAWRDHFDTIEATQAKHTEMLREHGATLKEHGDKLKEHDGRFDRIEATLADQGQMLREQRHLLEQILAKVA